jgi:polar amino acid transport system substrate-binding protein
MQRGFLLLIAGFMIAGVLLSGCVATPSSKVRVATDATWPPFEYINQGTKQIEGFDIDLLDAIAAIARLEFEYVNVGFNLLMDGMARCQYDLAISSITITPERSNKMLFSDPYFGAGQIVVVRRDEIGIRSKDDLGGRVAGAQVNTTGAMEINKIPDVRMKTYEDIRLAYEDLINGQIDAVVADNPISLYYVGKSQAKLKTVGNVFTDEDYGIAVCKSKKALLKKVNQGLKVVNDEGLIVELVLKWLIPHE